ncbi:MAG: hypothetical protein M0T84_18530 [Betaproteobacteria bacterium]|nr:hypothetical protein [Betaproteobacteria bacterium]
METSMQCGAKPRRRLLAAEHAAGIIAAAALGAIRAEANGGTGMSEPAIPRDASCAPDPQGLSHCHNGIDLDNGMRMTVIDTHAMVQHPCLKPGQRVALTGFDEQWLTVHSPGM